VTRFAAAPAPRPALEPDFEGRLRLAGITPDKPLHAVLTEVHAAAAASREAAGGLSPEGERQLMERVSRSIDGLVERRTRRIGWAVGLAGACVLVLGMAAAGSMGYWLGHRSGAAETAAVSAELDALLRRDPEVARVWLQLLRYNPHITRSIRTAGNVADVGGWIAGDVRLWLGPSDRTK
jgi:hypothetical protein